MERVKSYKYSVKLKEDVDISELLYVMSNPREVGIYFSKTIPHNNVIVIYAGTEKMTFQIGRAHV